MFNLAMLWLVYGHHKPTKLKAVVETKLKTIA